MRTGPARGKSVSPLTSLVALLGTLLLLLSGCGADTAEPPQAEPTPMSQLDSTDLAVARIDFCSLVSDEAIEAAVGSADADLVQHKNGEALNLSANRKELTQELGCSWSAGAATANAWLFARPVDEAFAATVIKHAGSVENCRTEPTGRFGAPTYTQRCRLPGGTARVRHAGLFGQTWVSCEVTEAETVPAAIADRAEAWCVEIANDLDTAG